MALKVVRVHLSSFTALVQATARDGLPHPWRRFSGGNTMEAKQERECLECEHCGDVAVWADRNGMFGEGDADRCISCEIPGHISVDDDIDEPIAHFLVSEEPEDKCNNPKCDDCQAVSK
jgi:hypothetical protein